MAWKAPTPRRPRRTRIWLNSWATSRPSRRPAELSGTRDGAPPRWNCRTWRRSRTPRLSPRRKLKLSKKTQSPRYVIGIDLGTTNSGAAYAEIRPGADPFAPANVELLPIPQLTNPGEVRDEDLLPSFLYLPGPSDFPAGSLALPWDETRDYVVGRLAQKRGVENAGRLVSSAKSWLSHSAVDRTAPLLPFRAPEGVAKISPVEASRRYLDHLRQAWDAKMPDAPFQAQQVLVTVPASFDAGARELTLDAARQAGYGNIRLATRTSRCWKSRRPRSTRGWSAIRIGASGWRWATSSWWWISAVAPRISR